MWNKVKTVQRIEHHYPEHERQGYIRYQVTLPYYYSHQLMHTTFHVLYDAKRNHVWTSPPKGTYPESRIGWWNWYQHESNLLAENEQEVLDMINKERKHEPS